MTAADRPTEPPVECVAVDRDERCLCPGGPASHRPSLPAPAAEDDAVEKAARVWHAEDATEPRAWDALSDDERGWYIATTRKSLAAAGVSALRAEVDRAERDWKQASEDADRWFARAEAAEAEVERLRAAEGVCYHQNAQYLAMMAERDEARRQVADLRAGIEALPHLTVNTDGGRMTVVRVDDLNRALLAGSGDVESPAPNVATSEGRDKAVARSGEQPGEGHPRDRLCNDEAPSLVPPGLPIYCERTKGHEPPHAAGDMTWSRPAPVIPDSADVRDGLPFYIEDGAARVLVFKSGGRRPATASEVAMWDLLAVVGQGVTAEQAWDEGFADGKRHAFEGDDGPRFVNPYRAVVRSGEQGGDE